MKTVFKLLAFTSAIFIYTEAFGQSPSQQQIQELARSIGIYNQIEDQRITLLAQGERLANQYIKRISASLPESKTQFEVDAASDMKTFLANVSGVINTESAVQSYTDLLSQRLTSNDVSALIAFYESDVGKKFTQVNSDVMGSWTINFLSEVNKKMEGHVKSYAQNLMVKANAYKPK